MNLVLYLRGHISQTGTSLASSPALSLASSPDCSLDRIRDCFVACAISSLFSLLLHRLLDFFDCLSWPLWISGGNP
jgi:hypothetical protein